MAMKKITCTSLHRQRGVASLLIALVILVTITFVTLYTSRTILMEQKITTNEFRGRMAFEAAETGIEAVMAAQALGWLRTSDADNDGVPDGEDVPTLIADDIVFDANGDGTPAGNSNDYQLQNGSSVRVILQDVPNSDNMIMTNVTSIGTSDDGTATRTITQTIVALPPIPNMPDSPLLAHGGVVIGGAAQVINPEGHSTIWSGQDVNLGANNSTATKTADPASSNYPNCLGGSVQCSTVESSNREVVGVDIIEADTSLANLSDTEFFENFFGVKPGVFRSTRTDAVVSDLSGLIAANNEGKKIIWVDGNIDMQGTNTFGSLSEPSIIIVDGNYSGLGSNTFNGLLYVMGNIQGSGNVNVIGAAIVNGINSNAGGGLAVIYNSKVLKALFDESMPAGSGGSWRDF